ncbi:hypothetical protein Rhe02_89520 [Rhizocola hellebori]|uniref:THIF-type NAD/FAD binding fold domain-containing protein n=1 Tax=Rhizocola hellebori TaxID=1392758 RepID=A0A8J3VLJ0_9ACTN|nr:ThiF family adenylyltransferase [Rhizocola hellebori]GIH10885.1 hypothetical protein Rhe02_89520 [Rhizocola hellebori]
MDRFDRHRAIEGWDPDRLRRSTVVVVGVGALGNEVSRLLAMAGVGRLILCDPDCVELSNLSRTILFRESDIGRPKVEVAAEALHDLAPGTRVEPREGTLLTGVGLAELRDCSLVMSCLDARASRVLLAGRCGRVGQAMLDAGTGAWGGEVRYYGRDGLCYGCGLGDAGRAVEDDPHSCTRPLPEIPTAASAPISAIVGAWQAASAIRVLCGLSLPSPGVSLGFDHPPSLIDLGRPDPDCPLHDRIEPGVVTRIDLDDSATVESLLDHVDTGESLFSWSDFLSSDGFGVSRLVHRAPRSKTLREIGIAPREILPVRQPGPDAALRYLELTAVGEQEW